MTTERKVFLTAFGTVVAFVVWPPLGFIIVLVIGWKLTRKANGVFTTKFKVISPVPTSHRSRHNPN